MTTKKAVKKSAKKSAHTPKADAVRKKAAKIVKVKAELAKEVKVEKKRERTVREKISDAVEKAANFVNPVAEEAIVPPPEPPQPINSLDDLISAAWDEVRGIDPPVGLVAPDFVGILRAHADSALKGNAQEGDTQLARFEQAIQRLKPQV